MAGLGFDPHCSKCGSSLESPVGSAAGFCPVCQPEEFTSKKGGNQMNSVNCSTCVHREVCKHALTMGKLASSIISSVEMEPPNAVPEQMVIGCIYRANREVLGAALAGLCTFYQERSQK